VAPHEAAHQAVLKLLEAPSLRKLRAVVREQLLAQCGDGKDVEQGAISIEGERFDLPELRRRHHLGRCRGGRLRNPS